MLLVVLFSDPASLLCVDLWQLLVLMMKVGRMDVINACVDVTPKIKSFSPFDS